MPIPNLERLNTAAENASRQYESLKKEFYLFFNDELLDEDEISFRESPHGLINPDILPDETDADQDTTIYRYT